MSLLGPADLARLRACPRRTLGCDRNHLNRTGVAIVQAQVGATLGMLDQVGDEGERPQVLTP